MVFSSIPPYVDPANWHQQPHHHAGGTVAGASGGGSGGSQQQQQHVQLLSSQPPPPPPPPPPSQPGGAGSIRPGSMADRARMANIPMPETALKCPRCESTNTKFCYFNNYSLSQPRHFCKTCRRYWTCGGALRNVPVGGGCRRNKRTKAGGGGSSSKSPASSDRQTGSASSTNSVSSGSAGDLVGLGNPHAPPLRFMSPLLASEFAAAGGDLNYGLNYNTISAPMGDLNFHLASPLGGGGGGGSIGATGSVLFATGLEQWRVPQTQQFPFLGGLEGSPGLYPFDGSGEGPGYGAASFRGKVSASGVMSQLASVKMEDINPAVNLSRQLYLSNNNNNHSITSGNGDDDHHEVQYWGGATNTNTNANAITTTPAWTDLSGFSSSSNATNPL